jgi:hypothetical protein
LSAPYCSSPARASQNLDVDFAIEVEGEAAGCGGATVMGLDPDGDGFLSVRTGPGTGFSKLDHLSNGDGVRTCARSGQWYGVCCGNLRHYPFMGDPATVHRFLHAMYRVMEVEKPVDRCLLGVEACEGLIRTAGLTYR